jgi:hypothetical protein
MLRMTRYQSAKEILEQAEDYVRWLEDHRGGLLGLYADKFARQQRLAVDTFRLMMERGELPEPDPFWASLEDNGGETDE